MMALLAGSKLAAHTLQLTAGSSQLLPDIFPGVDHISYFNLRTDVATDLLLDTGHHLGAVAVPYALAVHEDFIMTVLQTLTGLGYTQLAPGKSPNLSKNRITAWNMHEALFLTLGKSIPARGTNPISLELYHLLREMRNCQIHNGGSVTLAPNLQGQVRDISPAAEAEWKRLAKRDAAGVCRSADLRFTTHDIFTVFAVTKSLGRSINEALRDGLAAAQWAAICVTDYAAQSSKPPRSEPWLHSLLGHAAVSYGACKLSREDVVAAAVETGYWPAGRLLLPRRLDRGARRARRPGTQRPA